MANKNFKVKNSITIPEPLALTEGGTGQTSASNALNALLPVQSSANTKFLQSDGTNVSWVANVAYQRGGTESRPASPTVGDLYYNTDYNYFESYTSNGWFPIAAAPGITTGVTATNQGSGRAYNNGQMSVAFTAATSGGSPTSFIVTPTPTTSPSTFTSSSSPVTVTGLASSTQYTYTVAATSPYGTSAASSASSGVTATTVPQAPSITADFGDAFATITITPGATGGSAITEYSITSSPASTTTTQTTSSSPYTFTGLTNGTAYTFTATATNANGTSAASSASNSVTPQAAINGYVALATATVTSGGTPNITFSSIPTGYTHLELRYTARGTAAQVRTELYLEFNGDTTTSNYKTQVYRTSGSSIVREEVANYIYGGSMLSANANSNFFGSGTITIPDFSSSSKKKASITNSGTNNGPSANGGSQIFGGTWSGTAAITQIKIIPTSGDIAQHSKFYLYGIK